MLFPLKGGLQQNGQNGQNLCPCDHRGSGDDSIFVLLIFYIPVYWGSMAKKIFSKIFIGSLDIASRTGHFVSRTGR